MVIKRATSGIGLKNPIIGWKKTYARSKNGKREEILVMLQITGKYLVDAREDGYYSTHKRRTSEALVLAQFKVRCRNFAREVGDMHSACSYSGHHSGFAYYTGEIVRPAFQEFEMSNEACAPGIHYFEDIQDALNY